MHSTEIEGAELASYRLEGVAYSWFDIWEDSREEGSPPARWSEFADAFIDHYLPIETKVAHAAEFENLKQGSMSVSGYHMRFARLSRYAIYMFPTMEARVRRFVQGLSPLVVNEASTATLNSDMKYGQLSGEGHQGRPYLFLSLQSVHHHQGPISSRGTGLGPARATGDLTSRSMGRGTPQPASSAATTSAAPPPARGAPTPTGRGAVRGGTQSSGGHIGFYAMRHRQSPEASPDVVTSILTFQSHDVYDLIDPDSTLSYVTPYVAKGFGIEPEQIHESFFISTPIGKSIVAARVYRDCVVTVRGRDTMADFIEFGMVDFDVIMGMDWHYSCFAKQDYRTKTIRFEFPNESLMEWKGEDVVPKGRFISYLKATKMINKWCMYHLVQATDTNVEAPTLESVPVVNEFPEVFPDELHGIPPDKDIEWHRQN
ncbi:uncharacterized protein [Nicotiana tomentosiformis]|uniref:uncharacterized protein n=1 Tax=Nicotiana tomentosiformis TaxID=4098 RepID=UPI00388CA8E3